MNDLLQLGKKYSNLVVLTAGADAHGACEEFAKYFPDRYFSFGLAFSNAVSVAAGFSLTGKMPLVVGNRFFSRAYEQMQDDICIPNLNVKFATGEKFCELPNLNEVFSLEEGFEEYGPKYMKTV
jgi:transketolase C-terminal domain/subunit